MDQVFLIFDTSRHSTEYFKEFHYLQLTIKAEIKFLIKIKYITAKDLMGAGG